MRHIRMTEISLQRVAAKGGYPDAFVARIFMALMVVALLVLTGCSNRPVIEPVQQFYRDGVPHTGRDGSMRRVFTADESFLPLAIYHGLAGDHHGSRYRLDNIVKAGFNTVHPWEGQPPTAFVRHAAEVGLQVIVHWPKDPEIPALAGSENLLAWYLDEEPSFLYPPEAIDKQLAAYDRRRTAIRKHDRERPIIVLDGPPTTKNLPRWKRWNTVGDVSSHFNYPVTVKNYRKYGPVERVAETATMARRLVDSRKPLWMVLQAFGGEARGWRMPEPDVLRSMAYASIIHGATGLIYFAYDSFVTRDDGVLGISPAPLGDYGVTRDYNTDGKPPLVATDKELERSRRLFAVVAALNKEMAELREAILSATSDKYYTVRHAGGEGRHDAVRTLLKPFQDAHLLLAINVDTDHAAVDVRFEQPVATLTPLFASAPPKRVTANGFVDDFAAEEVKLYHIRFSK